MISVDLSITMTAAVPRPDWTSFKASKSILILVGVKGESTGRHHIIFWVIRGQNILQGLFRGDYPIHRERLHNVSQLNLLRESTFPL
jgi:hypothetical protein